MLSNLWDGVYHDTDDSGGVKPKEEGVVKPVVAEALSWKPWFDALPEEARALVSERESGLKSALGTERDARKDAEKELRKAAGQAEKGSELQKQLEESADSLAASTTKSEFYEDAHKAGATNLKLAHAVAVTDELFDKRGNVNFDKMKDAYPELFGKNVPPRGDAGVGTGAAPGGEKKDMNLFIRQGADKR